MQYPTFIGASYQSQSPVADAERCANWYVETLESPGSKTRTALYPTPGVSVFAQVSDSPGRAFFEFEGRVFAVIGPTLYEVFITGATINRGTVLVDAHPATIQGNGDVADELFITSGGAGYVYDLTLNTLTAIPALATGTDMGDYLDGYFLSLDSATSTLRISDLADGTTWPPLQAQQRNAATDRWRRVLVANRDIWLFGSQTTDIWQNAGAFPFPFLPVPGANLQWGTAAPFSPAVLGSPIWLAASREGAGMVMQAAGYAAKRVSTHAVERKIQSYGNIRDARGWTYQEEGHSFYILSFPTAQATWGYDAATQLWHERPYWNTVTGEEEAWRLQWHVYAFNRHLALDRNTGTIYTQSIALGSDVGGAAIRRVRRAPHVQQVDRQRLFVSHFEVDMENGLGLPVGQGEDPTIMCRVSRDGARTWGPERWTSAGRQGEYRPRVDWTRLGTGRDLVFEVTVSDPIPWRLVGAFLDVLRGES